MEHYKLTNEGLEAGLDSIEEYLTKLKIDKKVVLKHRLLAEESICKLMEKAVDTDYYTISFFRFFANVSIKISCKGDPVSIQEILDLSNGQEIGDADNDEALEYIRTMLFRSLQDNFTITNKGKSNIVKIKVSEIKYLGAILCLIATILGFALGFLLKAVLPIGIFDTINTYFLAPVQTIYTNLLNVLIGPIVFLSMACSLMQFSNVSLFGRIGTKVFGTYIITSAIASAVGYGLFNLINPGEFGSFTNLITQPPVQTPVSFVDIIINMFPENIISAFGNSNIMQLLILGVAFGITITVVGEKAKPVANILSGLNEIFLKLVMVLSDWLPLITFFTSIVLVFSTGAESILPLLSLFGVVAGGFIIMVILYTLLISVTMKVNPLRVLKKYAPIAAEACSIASSNVSIPLNMDFCKKLGLPPKVYSFAIPFGATVNMDGLMIMFIAITLFMAKTFGIILSPAQIFMLIATGILISMATPGFPGASIVGLTILLNQFGIPMESLPLILVIVTLAELFCTAINTYGDVAVAVFVSRTEGKKTINL